MKFRARISLITSQGGIARATIGQRGLQMRVVKPKLLLLGGATAILLVATVVPVLSGKHGWP